MCQGLLRKGFEDDGETMQTEEVMQEVLKDTGIYDRSGGGMTVTGGGAVRTTEVPSGTSEKSKGKQSAHDAGKLYVCRLEDDRTMP